MTRDIKSLMHNKGPCTAFARLERDCYQPEDTVKIDIDIDNSQCSEHITKIKTILYREIRCFDNNRKKVFKTYERLAKMKSEGLGEKMQKNLCIHFDLATIKNKTSHHDPNLPQEEKDLAK